MRRTIYRTNCLQTLQGSVRHIYQKTTSAKSNIERSEIFAPIDSDSSSRVLYKNSRRLESVGLTILAGGQASFWSYVTVDSTHTLEPVLGIEWSAGGLGLSALFAVLITSYLKRLVAQVHLLNGPVIRVTTHGLGGCLRKPFDVPAVRVVPGSKTDSRHLTFGIKTGGGHIIYYHVDMKYGVKDPVGLAAIADGGDHVVKWAQKRDAESMQRRWRDWYSKLTNQYDGAMKNNACL